MNGQTVIPRILLPGSRKIPALYDSLLLLILENGFIPAQRQSRETMTAEPWTKAKRQPNFGNKIENELKCKIEEKSLIRNRCLNGLLACRGEVTPLPVSAQPAAICLLILARVSI